MFYEQAGHVDAAFRSVITSFPKLGLISPAAELQQQWLQSCDRADFSAGQESPPGIWDALAACHLTSVDTFILWLCLS